MPRRQHGETLVSKFLGSGPHHNLLIATNAADNNVGTAPRASGHQNEETRLLIVVTMTTAQTHYNEPPT